MSSVSKLIFGAAIAAVSIASPALAAHKGEPISAQHNGYVTRSTQGRGLYNFVPTPSCPGLPYCDPRSGISFKNFRAGRRLGANIERQPVPTPSPGGPEVGRLRGSLLGKSAPLWASGSRTVVGIFVGTFNLCV